MDGQLVQVLQQLLDFDASGVGTMLTVSDVKTMLNPELRAGFQVWVEANNLSAFSGISTDQFQLFMSSGSAVLSPPPPSMPPSPPPSLVGLLAGWAAGEERDVVAVMLTLDDEQLAAFQEWLEGEDIAPEGSITFEQYEEYQASLSGDPAAPAWVIPVVVVAFLLVAGGLVAVVYMLKKGAQGNLVEDLKPDIYDGIYKKVPRATEYNVNPLLEDGPDRGPRASYVDIP